MQDFQREFLDFAVETGVLCFGEFTLKSGRLSPYFFNSGLFNSGASIAALGRYYAATIEHSEVEFDILYGPAYKGIPLAVAAVTALADHHSKDVPYAFNRKEAKDHGEGGIIVGAPLKGRVLIVDDVISAGTSVRESVQIIEQAGARVAGVVIALDRQERGQGGTSAIQEIETQFGLRVTSIATLDNLVAYLGDKPDMVQSLDSVRAYRSRYGTTA